MSKTELRRLGVGANVPSPKVHRVSLERAEQNSVETGAQQSGSDLAAASLCVRDLRRASRKSEI